MENIKSLWGKVLNKLQVVLSSVSYELWFEPIEVLEYRDNKVLVLVAPSTTARNQILKKFVLIGGSKFYENLSLYNIYYIVKQN